MTPVPPAVAVTFLKNKVMLTLPWYREAHPLTAFAVAQIADKRRTHMQLCFDDAFIVHARNKCAASFLKTDCEWELMIDSDMLFPFGSATWFNSHTGFNLPDKFAGFNTLDRLLSHGKTLVGGLYFSRNRTGVGVFNESQHPDMNRRIRSGPEDAIIPTKWVGTGCLLVHRSVYLDIESKFPGLGRGPGGTGGNWYSSSEHTAMDWIDKTRAMLSTGVFDGEKALRAFTMLESASAEARANSKLGQGEDVTFCIRAAAAGHQPFVDLGLRCGHIGSICYGPHNTGLKC